MNVGRNRCDNRCVAYKYALDSVPSIHTSLNMPDWDSPAETVRDNVYLTTTLHVCCGCAIWEYITQLRYEWDVFRGSGQYRWTIWVYSNCRLSMLISLLLSIATAEGWSKNHCTALYATAMAISYVSIGLASLLIVLRVVAVWDKRLCIVITSYIIWLSGAVLNFRGRPDGFSIHANSMHLSDVTLLRASYNATLGACTPYNTSKFLPNSWRQRLVSSVSSTARELYG
ncbi:hypothetical protein PENSPDRAFT_343451 [Peniophora sp. CONT]|nr:hypothetical protein PENSPDRAFT_343451 [Peniophora sp. CONT]